MIRKIVLLSVLFVLAASTAVLVGCSEWKKDAPATVNTDTTPSNQAAAKKAGSDTGSR